MHDNTAKALQEAKDSQEMGYLQEIENLSQEIDRQRKEIFALLVDRPAAAEYLVGDMETGYKYVYVEPKRVVEPVMEADMIEVAPPVQNGHTPLEYQAPPPGLSWPVHMD